LDIALFLLALGASLALSWFAASRKSKAIRARRDRGEKGPSRLAAFLILGATALVVIGLWALRH